MGILMYADDLVLISASVCKLQTMISICVDALHNLDLKVNFKKSTCMRIGTQFKYACVELTVDGFAIPWVQSITYLGVTLKSASKCLIDLKPARTKFYRAFNSLYSKISKANEFLITSLLKTFCVPVILYGLEAFSLNTSNLRTLDTPLYNAMAKIFKSFDHNTLNWCMFYTDVLPLRLSHFKSKINFLSKMLETENNVIIYLFNQLGRDELHRICNNFNFDRNYCNKFTMTEHFVSNCLH